MFKKANKIYNLWKAVKKGEQLKNVNAWKEGGVAISVVTSILSAALGVLYSLDMIPQVDEMSVIQVSASIVSVVSFILTYIQVATTKRIGTHNENSYQEYLKNVDVSEAQEVNEKLIDDLW